MDRTFALGFWIVSLTFISFSETGVPLNLRCTSRPGFSTFSRSNNAPFLSAESHLSFLPNFVLPGPATDEDADKNPKQVEPISKTVVILHKNSDENVEITITKKRKETNDNEVVTNESNEQEHSDVKEIIDDIPKVDDEVVDSADNDRIEDITPIADGEDLPAQDDENNNSIVEEDTETITKEKETIESNADDSVTDENN